jgi:hypothetical protein
LCEILVFLIGCPVPIIAIFWSLSEIVCLIRYVLPNKFVITFSCASVFYLVFNRLHV